MKNNKINFNTIDKYLESKNIQKIPEMHQKWPFSGPQKTPRKWKKDPQNGPFLTPQKSPKLPFLTTFWTPNLTPKMSIFDQNPKNDPFSTPPRFQKSWKMALLAKTGVFKQDLNRKKGGGVGVYPGTPQKGHFWPFLTIFGDFWPFLTPFLGCPRPPKNPPLRMWIPPKNPPGRADYI